MLLIYIPVATNRIIYVVEYLFKEQLGIEYTLTTDKSAWLRSATPKFYYSSEQSVDGIYVLANGLLNEPGIRQPELSPGFYNGLPVLFAHDDKNSLVNFDVFAAVFYLLSRYEEYLGGEQDNNGNYHYRNSILHKLNILQIPVVEQWAGILKNALVKTFPSLEFRQKNCARCLPSFDIDVAYAYKHRSFVRTAGGFLKKMILFDIKPLKDQALTIFYRKQDMFDTYDYIFHQLRTMPAIFFFNMGNYGRFDKNPSHKNLSFRKLICSINEKYTVGLHPSYASNKIENLVAEEKNRMEKITGKKIAASRQHYLKMKLPQTYRTLMNAGINTDFTMGYYYTYGFRAGTCNPFFFFDLLDNKTTNFRIYPFVFMDGTLNDVLKMSIEEAKYVVSKLIDTIRNHDGLFIPLWHNSTLCNTDGWKGWREVFEHMMRELAEKKFKNEILS